MVREAIPQRLFLLGLIAAVLALAPVAHASPPDQSWITGLYDNADFDDVILLITNNLDTVQPQLVSSLCPMDSVVSPLSPAATAAPVLSPPSSGPSRAPPLAEISRL
jgi:hypothetical protein